MDADLTVIGAGVVGLAVAAELSGPKQRVFVLEKREAHGLGVSSRNSEVIHAGIYYPKGSLKAVLCVEGRGLIYEMCRDKGVPHKRLGKLIVAVTDNELDELEALRQRAAANGVSAVSLLDKDRVGRMEPAIRAAGALFSPDTGIVSAHALMDCLLQSAKSKGAEMVYGTEVAGIERLQRGYRISTISRSGERFDLVSERVINAAGLQSDSVSRMAGIEHTLHYCKGDYFSISNVRPWTVGRLVYPVPEKNHAGLGIHLTLDLNGRMRLGPDMTYINRVEDYRVEGDKAFLFYESAVRFLPFVRREDIVPDMSGIRPKLQGPGEGFKDFVISEDLPGFVNLVGIESPGLTAAPAIARYVKKMLGVG